MSSQIKTYTIDRKNYKIHLMKTDVAVTVHAKYFDKIVTRTYSFVTNGAAACVSELCSQVSTATKDRGIAMLGDTRNADQFRNTLREKLHLL